MHLNIEGIYEYVHSGQAEEAASWEDVAGGQLSASFSRMLTNELNSLDGVWCSVAHIYPSTIRRLELNNSEIGPAHDAKKGKGSIVLDRFHDPKQWKLPLFEVRR